MQLVYQVCYTRYHVSFSLWLIGYVLKHCKVPKYYDHDCRLYVLLDASIFTTIDEKKEEQQSTLQIFLKDVTEGKNVEIHKHS